MATNLKYTTPGLDEKDAERVVELLQDRLYAANDLHLGSERLARSARADEQHAAEAPTPQ